MTRLCTPPHIETFAHRSLAPSHHSQTVMPDQAQSPRQSVKEEILANLEHYTPGELRRMLVDLLTRQRVGLYWERDLIAQDRALNENNVFVELIEDEAGASRTCGAVRSRSV